MEAKLMVRIIGVVAAMTMARDQGFAFPGTAPVPL